MSSTALSRPVSPLWAEKVAVFDTETTGVDVETSRIVTATLAVIDGGGLVLERDDWLIDPGVEIPTQAAAVHGIDTATARRDGMHAAAGIAGILDRLGAVLDRAIPLVVYNAPYDLTILAREAQRNGLPMLLDPRPVIDPLVLDKQLDRFRRGKRTLTASAQHYGVVLDNAHDAGADAIAAGHLLQRIAERFAAELPGDVAELHEVQIAWAEAQARSYEDWARRNRDPLFTADGRWPLRHAL